MREENRKYIEELEREIEKMEEEAVEAVRNRLDYDLPIEATQRWIEVAMKKREWQIAPLRKLLFEARKIAGE